MTYDGSINFDTRIDTGNFNQGIQETRNLITNAIEQMLQIMESTMHQIEANATVTGQRIQAILDNISHSQNTQNRETIRDTTRTSQNIINTSQRTSDRITENSRQANRNIDNSTRTTSNRLLSTANGIVQRIRNRIRSASEQAREQVGSTVNHLENTFNGLKSKIIATFSTVAIISFGKQCIEASASVNALNSQIEQTFGSLKNQAEKAMQTVATESGIVETRLQSVGTSIYAFAKTSGMDSASALNMMKEALQVTADSAAYYDRSLEETAESLKSFLKGNYANDAALGISCTETTRNTAANKLYGKSFQELSEAQKQLTLLQMVKDANQLSGAMGQASREADGWENVIGNLKETWKQFLAVVGQPILQVATQVVKNLSSALQKLTEYAKQATNALSKVFGWDFGKDNSNSAVSDIADNTETLTENLDEADKSAKKFQKNLAGIDKLNVLGKEDTTDDNTKQETDLSDLSQITSAISDTESTINSLKSKLTDLFSDTGLDSFLKELHKGFDSVNWSAVKTNIDSIFSDLKPIASASFKGIEKVAKSSMTTFGKIVGGTVSVTGKSLQTVTGGIAKWLDKDKEKIANGITLISDNISSGIDNIGLFYESVFTTLGESIDRMRPTMETAIADCLSGFTTLGLSVGEVLSGAFSIVTEDIAQWAEDNKELLGSFFDGTQQNMATFLETVGHISDDIGSKLSDWWEESGAEAFDGFVETLLDVGATVLSWYTEYIQPVIDWIINSIRDIWDNNLSPLWENILDFISSVMEFISALWNFIKPFVNFIAEQVLGQIVGTFKVIWGVLTTVFKFITDSVSNIIKILKGILKFFTGVFTGDFDKAFEGIKDIIDGYVSQIWNIIKTVINIIIDGINSLWIGAYNIISGLVNSFSGIAETVGSLFGQDWSFRMPTEAPLIPKLATGTVVPASYGEFMAILGDNKREPEVVSPISAMKQAFKEAMAEMKLYQSSGGDIIIRIELDGKVIYEEVVRQDQIDKKRRGGRSRLGTVVSR